MHLNAQRNLPENGVINLKADKERFDTQIKFIQSRFEEEVKYLQSIMREVLDCLKESKNNDNGKSEKS